MADNAVPNARDATLIDWLDEAQANEIRLQADLTAHIPLIEKPAYRKRLQTHLTETKEHERLVARRIGQLGGQAAGPAVPAVVSAVGEAAGKAVARVKGEIASRAVAAEGAQGQVRVTEEQIGAEQLEIALYTRIEAFAEAVGDTETAKLARAILRDEQRMAKFLGDELPKLVRELVRAEIPRDQRVTRRRPTPSASAPPRARSASSRASSRSGSRSRSSG